MDVIRIGLIYYYLITMFTNGNIPQEVIPIMFFLLWVKIFKYLSVFYAFRHLIMMIQEILKDISTFLAILFLAMVAYGQIMLTMQKPSDDPEN